MDDRSRFGWRDRSSPHLVRREPNPPAGLLAQLAQAYRLSMIFPENRFAIFRIML
ncbi:hypothetical protein [Bradyrhizobium macuxiense]|uniref:hypothetical protein n=1 Tax=Bradyrhizobium macuxiense TaxID=1755647 RepID=UPI00142EF53B|nr:hypothetical protein [Bradyrhizobium macuxiense]